MQENLSTCTAPDFLLTVRIGELLVRFYRLPCLQTLPAIRSGVFVFQEFKSAK
jgi:hypothetical protein